MGQQVVITFRGKCESTSGKVCKNGRPKHAGNFSAATYHRQSLQSKDYRVRRICGHLLVAHHTPLLSLMPAAVVELAMYDPTFDSITLRWHKTIKGKQYEAIKRLTRYTPCGMSMMADFEFIYREEIYTDGEFKYKFPEY